MEGLIVYSNNDSGCRYTYWLRSCLDTKMTLKFALFLLLEFAALIAVCYAAYRISRGDY